MNFLKNLVVLSCAILITASTFCQNDSLQVESIDSTIVQEPQDPKDTLITLHGHVLIGELKSFERGVISFKTDYSYEDIKVKWKNVAHLTTVNNFKTFDRKGKLVRGHVKYNHQDSINSFQLIDDSNITFIKPNKIGGLRQAKDKFKDKLTLGVDLGYSKAKQNDAQQFSLGFKVGYEGYRWDILLENHSFASRQDTLTISRGDLSLITKLYLPRRWFLYGQANYFSSSALNLDGRFTPLAGAGNNIIYNNFFVLNVIAGATYNYEVYSNSSQAFESGEAVGLINIEYYPTADIDFVNNFMIFPSISEPGRTRLQFDSKLKFNYFDNLSIGLHYMYNLDSRPPQANAPKDDYIFELNLGWSL